MNSPLGALYGRNHMKKIAILALSLLLLASMLTLSSCSMVTEILDIVGTVLKIGEPRISEALRKRLDTPTGLHTDEESDSLHWSSVEYATGYTVLIDGVDVVNG